jgi:Spy/CpxP family protein refolding chaperone
MKRFIPVFIVLLICCSAAFAQAPSNTQRGPMPGFNFEAPRALSGDWWRDPEVVNELRLTDAQRKQLEQVSLNMKLSLISAAATAATALVKGESALNGDQLDESAYTQQVTAAADAASKLVKDVGGTMLAMRKILTPEQWRKLESMRRRAPEARRQPMPRENERRPAPPQE